MTLVYSIQKQGPAPIAPKTDLKKPRICPIWGQSDPFKAKSDIAGLVTQIQILWANSCVQTAAQEFYIQSDDDKSPPKVDERIITEHLLS